MAKQIVVTSYSQNDTQFTIGCVFWYPITIGARTQTAGSSWSGASPAENAAIQAGTVLEEGQSFTFPVGTLVATIKDTLNKAWTQRNTAIGGIGPNQYFGVFYDGTTLWSA